MGSDLISTIQHVQIAKEHAESFLRDHPKSAMARPFKVYRDRFEWVLRDIKTLPFLPEIVREGINQELKADAFAVPAINEKAALLSPDGREFVEKIIDALLKGEPVEVQLKKENY